MRLFYTVMGMEGSSLRRFVDAFKIFCRSLMCSAHPPKPSQHFSLATSQHHITIFTHYSVHWLFFHSSFAASPTDY